MSKTVGITIALLLSLLVGGGIYVFLETHERKQRTIHTGFFGEARKNPLYASRLFLKRMGIPTETKDSIRDLTGFPERNAVIVINSKRHNFSPKRTKALIRWVESGGHLIALATHNWKYNHASGEDNIVKADKNTSPDPLQRYLGIRTAPKIHYDDLQAHDQLLIDKIKRNTKDDDYKSDTLFKLSLKNVDKPLGIANSWYYPLIVDDHKLSETEIIKLRSSNFIIRQKAGKGMVTIVSDMSFIQNKQLEEADHAEILWQLIHGLHSGINQPSAVWLIHSDEISPLWDILWRNAWMFIMSLGFLFGAWLLLSTRRFGPMIPKQEEHRRSLIEHISSSGSYYWKHDNKQKLIDSSRHALMQRLSRVHPGWAHLNQSEQINLISDQFQLKPEKIQRILFAPNIEQTDEFINTVRQLENIRKST